MGAGGVLGRLGLWMVWDGLGQHGNGECEVRDTRTSALGMLSELEAEGR